MSFQIKNQPYPFDQNYLVILRQKIEKSRKERNSNEKINPIKSVSDLKTKNDSTSLKEKIRLIQEKRAENKSPSIDKAIKIADQALLQVENELYHLVKIKKEQHHLKDNLLLLKNQDDQLIKRSTLLKDSQIELSKKTDARQKTFKIMDLSVIASTGQIEKVIQLQNQIKDIQKEITQQFNQLAKKTELITCSQKKSLNEIKQIAQNKKMESFKEKYEKYSKSALEFGTWAFKTIHEKTSKMTSIALDVFISQALQLVKNTAKALCHKMWKILEKIDPITLWMIGIFSTAILAISWKNYPIITTVSLLAAGIFIKEGVIPVAKFIYS